MSVRPLYFSYNRIFPKLQTSQRVTFPIVFIDGAVVVRELIAAFVLCDRRSSSNEINNGVPLVYLSATNGGTVNTPSTCLFCVPLSNGTLNSASTPIYVTPPPIGSVRIDYTDGRGNGLLIPLEQLWINVSGYVTDYAATNAVVVNFLLREKRISFSEYESVKSTFG